MKTSASQSSTQEPNKPLSAGQVNNSNNYLNQSFIEALYAKAINQYMQKDFSLLHMLHNMNEIYPFQLTSACCVHFWIILCKTTVYSKININSFCIVIQTFC